MLLVSLLFMLAGMSLLTAAGIMATYAVVSAGEKNPRLLLDPGNWPPALKKWARRGGMGLASTLLGMILAALAT